ncbi:MAG: C-terminal helicase domain-containing protein, partial [Leadbetterella sp.]
SQIELAKTMIQEGYLPQAISKKIRLDSVDSFQGQESDIVLISMVRSNPEGKIGFLSDIRRMNVALTRARKKLVVIGDSSTLCQHSFYNQFNQKMQDLGSYVSCWEHSELMS